MLNLYQIKYHTKTIDLTDISRAIDRLKMNLGVTYNKSCTSNTDVYSSPILKSEGHFVVLLLDHPEIAVAIATLSAGSEVDTHDYTEVEILKVISGMLKVIMMNEEHLIDAGELILNSKGKGRYSIAIGDTEVLDITVPVSIALLEVL